MKRKDFVRFLEQRCHQLERHARNLLHDFEAEDIHQFRVEIKKLRAFLHLVNAGRKEGQVVHTGKNIRSFYKAAGDLRSLQLQKQILLQLGKKWNCTVPDTYLEQLDGREGEAKKALRQAASQVSFSRFERKLVKAVGEKPGRSAVENFLSIKKQALQRALATGFDSDGQLHQLRKLLKEILYVWPLIGPAIVAAFANYRLTKPALISLTEKLGAFQDMCVAINSLEAVDESPVSEGERAVLDTLRSHCGSRKILLKEQIAGRLTALRKEMEEKDRLFKVYEMV